MSTIIQRSFGQQVEFTDDDPSPPYKVYGFAETQDFVKDIGPEAPQVKKHMTLSAIVQRC